MPIYTLCSDDVESSVKSLSANKACGLDNLFAEHILFASPSIHARQESDGDGGAGEKNERKAPKRRWMDSIRNDLSEKE